MAAVPFWTDSLLLSGDADGQEFGDSVQGSATHIVAGDGDGQYAKVYDNAGVFLFRIDSPETTPESFGEVLTINSTYIYITDYGYNTNGAVYIYDLLGSLVNTIYGTVTVPVGYSIAVSETHMITGWENAEVPVYNADGSVLQGTIPYTGTPYFGYAVALTDDHAFVTGFPDVSGLTEAGSVVVYDLATFTLVRTLTASIPNEYGYFGWGMHGKGNRLVIGGDSPGTANIYTSDGTFYSHILCNSCNMTETFGSTVYVGDNYILVMSDYGRYDYGTVQVFTLNGGYVSTVDMVRLQYTDISSQGENFLSMTGDTILIGGDDIPSSGGGDGGVIILDQKHYDEFTVSHNIEAQIIDDMVIAYSLTDYSEIPFEISYGVDQVENFYDFTVSHSVQGNLSMVPFDILYSIESDTPLSAKIITRINS